MVDIAIIEQGLTIKEQDFMYAVCYNIIKKVKNEGLDFVRYNNFGRAIKC